MFLENLRLKLRYILWPYGRALGLLALAVAGVNAALFACLPLFEPPHWLWVFVGPLVLAGLVIWRLWGSFRLIRAVKLGRTDLREVAIVVAFGTLAFTAGVIPFLAKATCSRPRRLVSIASLPAAPPARYYLVPRLQADTRHVGWMEEQETRKGTTYFRLFAACPVWVDTARQHEPALWLGFRYATSVQALNDAPEAAAAFSRFRQACHLALAAENANRYDHLERCPNTEQRLLFRQAAQNSPSYHEADHPPLLLLPVATSLVAEA